MGNWNAKLMVIGQSPGATEVANQQPFIGPAGGLFDMMLHSAGLTRDDCYIANTLKCRPPGNRRAEIDERNTCWNRWMKYELARCKAKVVLLLGKDAHLTNIPARYPFRHLSRVVGKSGRIWLTSYHPAHYLYSGDMGKFLKLGPILRRELDGTATSVTV